MALVESQGGAGHPLTDWIGTDEALGHIGKADSRVTESLHGGPDLLAGRIPDDHDLEVGVGLGQCRGNRAADQNLGAIAARGDDHRHERLGLGVGELVIGGCPQDVEAAPVSGVVTGQRHQQRADIALDLGLDACGLAGDLGPDGRGLPGDLGVGARGLAGAGLAGLADQRPEAVELVFDPSQAGFQSGEALGELSGATPALYGRTPFSR